MLTSSALFSTDDLQKLKNCADKKRKEKAEKETSTTKTRVFFRNTLPVQQTKQTITLKLLDDSTVVLFSIDGSHVNCKSAEELWRRIHSASFVSAANKKQTVEEYLAAGGKITQCPAAKAENYAAGFFASDGRRPVAAVRGKSAL